MRKQPTFAELVTGKIGQWQNWSFVKVITGKNGNQKICALLKWVPCLLATSTTGQFCRQHFWPLCPRLYFLWQFWSAPIVDVFQSVSMQFSISCWLVQFQHFCAPLKIVFLSFFLLESQLSEMKVISNGSRLRFRKSFEINANAIQNIPNAYQVPNYHEDLTPF